MSDPETAEQIADSATEWVSRLDAAGNEAHLQARFREWVSGDPRRQGAFLRAQAAWQLLDRASVLGPAAETPDVRDEAPNEAIGEQQIGRRRLLAGGSAIVGSGLAAALGISLWRNSPMRIVTSVGEIRRIPLADGSLAAVNTASSLDVAMRDNLRQVALNHGEAWFQVAKDRNRPFVVEAGNARIRAVGTAFAVRRSNHGAEVQVTEGVVEVWITNAAGNVRRIAAGESIYLDANQLHALQHDSTRIEQSLGWRNGELIFDGDTVEDAVKELNRYNVLQVTVVDSELAQERLVGRFQTNEPEKFAFAAAALVNGRAVVMPDRIELHRN